MNELTVLNALIQFYSWYFPKEEKKQEKPSPGAIKDFTKMRMIPK